MNIETYFDSPERADTDKIVNDYLLFRVNPLISEVLEGFPEFVVILNKNRQIVAFNNKALTAFSAATPEQILGKRVGEAINCIHSKLMPGGCGTSSFCKECGAAQAIKHTVDTKLKSEEECKITGIKNDKEISYEFSVYTQPITFKENNYTLFSVKDISSVKRKETLEKIFFHDILNTSGAINGIAQLLNKEDDAEERELLIKSLVFSSEQLLNEIVTQQEIRYAEEGNLQINIKKHSVNDILKSAFELYQNHELAVGKNFVVSYLHDDTILSTDKTLLVRSICNLIKNALEASSQKDEVKLYSYKTDDRIYFNVTNPLVIPENVQLQLFQRSFSTKQKKGRGIGLYSVKLIIEQNLKGKVSFVSNEQVGTIFTIEMPKHFIN
ncbi:MAG: HAMP domain-containing sensor histidine kinase [Bacteroidota bacterium]